MNYTFPVIENINDLLPYIVANPSISILDRKWFDCVCYNILTAFDNDDETTHAFSRECRGIAFDKATGQIIARPPHKFFNVGQTEDTQPHVLSDDYEILDKVDGSLIFPVYNIEYDAFRLSTKRGVTDTAMSAETYISRHSQSRNFFDLFRHMWEQGYTPYFEYIDPKNGIIVDHGDTQKLVLLGARKLTTGIYMPYTAVKFLGDQFGIEVVQRFDFDDIRSLIQKTKDLQGVEGYVLNFPNGHKVKAKTEWYVARSRFYDDMYEDYRLAYLVLTGATDDIVGLNPLYDKRIVGMETFLRTLYTTMYLEVERKLAEAGLPSKKEISLYHQHKFRDLELLMAYVVTDGQDSSQWFNGYVLEKMCQKRNKFTSLVDKARNWYNIQYK